MQIAAPPPAARLGARGVPMLNRALDALEHLRGQPGGATLSEVARALGCPRNTAYRILNTFAARDYVRRDVATMRFTLSRRLARMAYDGAEERSLLEHAAGPLRRLRDATGETAVISVLDRQEGLVLDQVQGIHPFRFVCDPGTRQLIYASASTKCILAFLPPADASAALRGVRIRRQTERTLTSRAAFVAALGEVRRQGYAVDHAEALDGVHCVAAPVFDAKGCPVAALTITGPAERLPASLFEATGARVRAAADEVSRQLGYAASSSQ